MPSLKTSLLALLAASFAFALPTPQDASSDVADAPLQISVSCGCWNLCTLQRLADPSITDCDSTCDPRFSCQALEAQNTTSAGEDTTAVKRDVEMVSRTPPRNPFTSGSLTGEKDKRRIPVSDPTLPDPTFPEGDVVVKEKREPRIPINDCVCVVAEGCPCGGGNTAGSMKERRDAHLNKRFPPTDVRVECSTSGSCTGSITIHF